MASPSAGDHTQRKVPSRYTVSLLSRTNSTVSNITGAGRFVGSLLSAAARRIEPALNRAAERLGFGPIPLVRRLLTLILERHKVIMGCNLSAKIEKITVELILDIAHYPCRLCRTPIDCAIADDLRPAIPGILVKLVQFLR